jgi:transcriptional regulator of aromatic amino acid metabolism
LSIAPKVEVFLSLPLHEAEVEAGTFREDFFYRINVVEIRFLRWSNGVKIFPN